MDLFLLFSLLSFGHIMGICLVTSIVRKIFLQLCMWFLHSSEYFGKNSFLKLFIIILFTSKVYMSADVHMYVYWLQKYVCPSVPMSLEEWSQCHFFFSLFSLCFLSQCFSLMLVFINWPDWLATMSRRSSVPYCPALEL